MYEFVCTSCEGLVESSQFQKIGQPHDTPCPRCGGKLLRYVGSFGVSRSMPEHFNHAVGKVIHTKRQFKSELERASDIQSERTGVDAHFVPVEPGDREGLGVTDEGLDETRRMRQDSGMDASTKKIIV